MTPAGRYLLASHAATDRDAASGRRRKRWCHRMSIARSRRHEDGESAILAYARRCIETEACAHEQRTKTGGD